MRANQFITNRHGLKIALSVNEHASSVGLVFIMPGLGGFRGQAYMEAIEQVFLGNNFTTVSFDPTNSVGESGGKYEDATMENYYNDLEDVITWSENQPWFRHPVYLIGQSLGGYAVLRYAEEHPKAIQNVIALAPVVSGALSWEAHQHFSSEEFNEWKETGWRVTTSRSIPGLEKRLPWSHMTERLQHDIVPKAGNLIMPILIIVGDNDPVCPPDHQKILFDCIPGTKKKLVILENIKHGFYDEAELGKLKEALSAWINIFK